MNRCAESAQLDGSTSFVHRPFLRLGEQKGEKYETSPQSA